MVPPIFQNLPELAKEPQLLDERGYSDLAKAKEFTVIIEALICKFYSCLDGLQDAFYRSKTL